MTPVRAGSPATVRLPDGRDLAYATYGDPNGQPLLICHGDAQSRLGYRWLDAQARQQGIKLICPERPGYGCSDRAPRDYTFARWTEDLRLLLEALDIERFTVCGVSAGGGYALAAAAALGDRVRKTVVISGTFPFTGAGQQRALAWYAPLMFWATTHLTSVLRPLTGAALRRYWGSDAALDRLMHQLPEADRTLLARADVRAEVLSDSAEAMRQGPAGTMADSVSYAHGLGGLQLSAIVGPIVFIHGTADSIMQPRVVEAAHRLVPSSTLRWVEGGGHLIMLAEPGLLLDEVEPIWCRGRPARVGPGLSA